MHINEIGIFSEVKKLLEENNLINGYECIILNCITMTT
jgi:hypothetical protein